MSKMGEEDSVFVRLLIQGTSTKNLYFIPSPQSMFYTDRSLNYSFSEVNQRRLQSFREVVGPGFHNSFATQNPLKLVLPCLCSFCFRWPLVVSCLDTISARNSLSMSSQQRFYPRL